MIGPVIMPAREEVAKAIASQAGVPRSDEVDALADRAIDRCADLAASARRPIPAAELLGGVVDVGCELLFRKRARNGVVVLGESDSGVETTRVAGDPTSPARKSWAYWLGPGIA
ncbi:hypothetical protein [Rathayibacter sp. AY1A7]|uniref:hypothetical protein n=1 Tax=Rathayibacter sp. AY1A7 TaxID=2080524 RepID=UPI000CE9146D|nr:hypothetical protein [Rathayibacter sp. AY1A7]PPF21028.1 hypothetical protein C5B95_06355 [Rathayibacter sp. AY1A7]